MRLGEGFDREEIEVLGKYTEELPCPSIYGNEFLLCFPFPTPRTPSNLSLWSHLGVSQVAPWTCYCHYSSGPTALTVGDLYLRVR